MELVSLKLESSTVGGRGIGLRWRVSDVENGVETQGRDSDEVGPMSSALRMPGVTMAVSVDVARETGFATVDSRIAGSSCDGDGVGRSMAS